MPHCGQISGPDGGHDGTWLVALDADGTPVDDLTLVPLEAMPDVVPVWSIDLPIGSPHGIACTADDPVQSALSTCTPKRR